MAIYFSLLPENLFRAKDIYILRYFLWTPGLILLITFIPFLKIKGASIHAFWHYNKIISQDFLATVSYGAFIFIGLSIAFGSIDYLLGIDIDSKRYMELWICVAGIFSPLFFLSRIPQNPLKLNEIDQYPRELKIFTQYVLIPLVALYFFILYIYSGKIIVTGEWPRGTVSYMILGFSLLGIATCFFLYPLMREKYGIRIFSRVFYMVLIPQAGMLFWAIGIRISQYGITEKRYLVVAFGLWLFGMALYFLLSRKKDIRLIPLSLFLVVFLTSFGPWGAFSVSEKSQIQRLKEILQGNGIFVNDQVQRVDREVGFTDRKQISAIIRYLHKVHGLDRIQDWFSRDLKELEKGKSPYDPHDVPRQVTKLLGLEYIERWKKEDFFYFHSRDQRVLNVSGYDYMLEIHTYGKAAYELNWEKYLFKMDMQDLEFLLLEDKRALVSVSLQDFLQNLVEMHVKNKQNNFHPEEMAFVHEDRDIKLKIYFLNINGKKKKNDFELTSMSGKLLFSIR